MAGNRTLPHNLDAEASVLGGIFLRNDVLAQLDTLEPEDFYDGRHRAVFEAMRNLESTSRPIDVVTLEHALEKAGKLEAIGGVAFLGELALRVPTADNVEHYARIVQDKARARRLMLVAGDLVEKGYEDGLDVDEYFNMALTAISRLDRSRPDAVLPVGDLVKRRVREIETLVQARERGELAIVGVPTGIAGLDKHLGGYPRGDVSLLAARPAMGKTSMAMAAVDATTAAGQGAIVFSQEGGWRMYADRCIGRSTGISIERLRSGDLGAADFRPISDAMVRYHHRGNWMVDDRAGLSAPEIIRTVRRWKAKLDLRLVVIDYVQIIRRSRGLDENAALDEIITAFSHAALADDLAYLVLCQLNRKVEERSDKRPQLADLRGSGALEERPRVIVSPYRGSYYSDEPKKGVDYDCDCIVGAPCRCAPDADRFAKTVQVLVLKNNNGATGRVFASWRGETTEMW